MPNGISGWEFVTCLTVSAHANPTLEPTQKLTGLVQLAGTDSSPFQTQTLWDATTATVTSAAQVWSLKQFFCFNFAERGDIFSTIFQQLNMSRFNAQ